MQIRLRSHSRNNSSLSPLPDLWNLDQSEANQTMSGSDSEDTSNANSASTVWKTHPFKGNRINPGTDSGRKIFEKKTQGVPEEDRLDLTKSNSLQLKQLFNARAEHLGSAVTGVPIEFNPDGTVKKTASLLTQSHMIKLTDMQRAAHKRYRNSLSSTDPIPSMPFILAGIDPGNR